MSQPRILLCGDVVGRLDQLFKRVAAVNTANGPFDALFCVGQFFPLDEHGVSQVREYIDGAKEIPLPTYFTGNYGEEALQLLAPAKDRGLVSEPVVVSKNLFWLRGSGVVFVHELRIAFLSGKSDALAYEDAKLAADVGAFHQDDVDALRALADDSQVIDLFLTNDWPQGVLSGSKGEIPSENVSGNPVIAELAAELRPRYHVAGSEGVFFTREPYTNQGVPHVTRFVALGVVGNDKKQKYLHALSPTPASKLSSEELAVTPPNSTLSPYENRPSSKKRPLSEMTPSSQSEGQFWRYDTSDAKKTKRVEGACFDFVTKGSCARGDRCKFKHTFENGVLIPKRSCYDFITKGSCERGSECRYLHSSDENASSAAADNEQQLPPGSCFNFFKKGSCEKGDDCRFSHSLERKQQECWFCLASPNVETHLVASVGDHCYVALAKGPLMDKHMLIVPIEHTPSAVCVSREVEKELEMYKDSLRKFFESQGSSIIIFERYINIRAGTHAHVQVVPVSSSAAASCREAFDAAASELGFSFIIMRRSQSNDLRRLLDRVNYFVVELPDGTTLAHPCAAGEKMPMQFGREVLAGLLGTPEKTDWKACKLTKDEETKLVEDFKQQFQAFDPMQYP
ncbi:hypothetical protein SELMODRAFT_445909 [Selaginella moellendorffii]|uniref:C3H1-type domain-containing protein n=1 Tax=Selaginella moellendorffii TaxID=88036 RepID=D8SM84_SELML|nr:zinc finger CCCH domain-containing protein 64 isoform X1 [Selaginella moellendorffii]EFJ14443.1 hypothetical protein SELMODRAFT_445909 [Selaginella moellendorffii]|eukprot:XP_002984393.1 zinc finger CCCH domain-containing protein 64 isoform X1 [Selaginella moellendorffii]